MHSIRLHSLLLAITLFLSAAQAEILEIKNIDSVREHIKPGTWLILDIDNTVVRTAQTTGSDQWFRNRIKEAQANGETFEKALDEWTMLQFRSAVVPAEEATVPLIADVQRRGLTLMAETSRGIRLGERTVTQLRDVGVDFRVTAPSHDEIFWPRGVEETDREHVLYEGGILFSAGQNKGHAFEKLVAKLGVKPEHVIFVDDSRKHVEHMAESCEKLGIAYTGLRYGHLDEWVNSFDPEMVRLQFAGFERIPSDEEVRQRMKQAG